MTIVVDTGSPICGPGEESISTNERGKEKERGKHIQAALPFGQPPNPQITAGRPPPKAPQPQDKHKAGKVKAILQEGKLPDKTTELWAKELPKSPGAEEERTTTVSISTQQGMNRSKAMLGQAKLDKDVEKMEVLPDKPPVQLKRKKSTVARVADCFHGIKSRYGSSTSNEIAATPRKERQPKVPPSTGIPAPSVAPTTSPGAISNQPVKPARRTASLKAFFRYFDEGKPVAVPRRAKSTPATSAAVGKVREAQGNPSEGIPRPTTAPPTAARSARLRQRANNNSGYTSDGPPVVTRAPQRRATGDHLNVPATSKNPKLVTPKPPIIDVRHLVRARNDIANQRNEQKPLPKLPNNISTFPAPTPPPRPPSIKAAVSPPQLPPQAQPTTKTTSTPPLPTHKIIPWDELNRRLAKETEPSSMGAQLRKSSVSAGISHRRGRSADSGYTMSGSEPLSFGVSRPTTAVVKNAEVAINGFGMKSKLVSVGKIGSQIPVPSASAKDRAMLARGVRRVSSDDTIRSGAGSWRLMEHRRAELKRPQVRAGKEVGVGLGIDMSEELPRIGLLEVHGGRTIAIGVIPED